MSSLPPGPVLHNVGWAPAGRLGVLPALTIHFQGCRLRCPGCWNPGGLEFSSEKVPMRRAVQQVHMAAIEGWDGHTGAFSGTPDAGPGRDGRFLTILSGGEPLDYPYLEVFLEKLHETSPRYEFFLYTGHLTTTSSDAVRILHMMESLKLTGYCAGPYIQSQPGGEWPATSANQKVLLTGLSKEFFGDRRPRAFRKITKDHVKDYGYKVTP